MNMRQMTQWVVEYVDPTVRDIKLLVAETAEEACARGVGQRGRLVVKRAVQILDWKVPETTPQSRAIAALRAVELVQLTPNQIVDLVLNAVADGSSGQ